MQAVLSGLMYVTSISTNELYRHNNTSYTLINGFTSEVHDGKGQKSNIYE